MTATLVPVSAGRGGVEVGVWWDGGGGGVVVRAALPP